MAFPIEFDPEMEPYRIPEEMNFGQVPTIAQMRSFQMSANAYVRNRIMAKQRTILLCSGLQTQLLSKLKSDFNLTDPIAELISKRAMVEVTKLTDTEKNLMEGFTANETEWVVANHFSQGMIYPYKYHLKVWMLLTMVFYLGYWYLGSYHFSDGILQLVNAIVHIYELTFVSKFSIGGIIHKQWEYTLMNMDMTTITCSLLSVTLLALTILAAFRCVYLMNRRFASRLFGTVSVPRG